VRTLAILLTLSACGGAPIGANVPTPNKAAAAGVAAGAAAALTLADPNGAAKSAEAQKTDNKEGRPQKSGGTVPADVLDRLDEKQKPNDPPTRPE
jgi:hypothetical protein